MARRNISVTDEAYLYRAVEKLQGFGLLEQVVVGQRPWSHSYFQSLVREAQKNVDTIKDVEVEIRARRLLKELTHFHPKLETQYDTLFLDGSPRTFNAYQKGRTFGNTHNASFEARHSFDFLKYLSFAGNAHFLFRQDRATEDDMKWGFDTLYLRGEFGNVALQIGRDVLVLGQSPQGGVSFSTNATPLDMFKFSNIHPWSFLGGSQLTLYFSVLEDTQARPYPLLAGGKFSFHPFSFLELGGGYSGLFDERNSNWAAYHGVSADGRLHFQGLRGLSFYYEIFLEDLSVEEGIYRVGLFLPRLDKNGNNSLRLEWEQAGSRVYRHPQFASGWTRNDHFLGSDLGPDAWGVSMVWGYEATTYFYFSQVFAYERRHLIPDENRFRSVSQMEAGDREKKVWHLGFGYERQETRDNFLVRIGLKILSNFF